MFILVCAWFVGSLLFVIFSSVSITHAVLFSKQEVLRRQAADSSSRESDCSGNDWKKKQS